MCQQSISFPLHPSQLTAVLQGLVLTAALPSPRRLSLGEQLWAKSRPVIPFAQMLA